MIKYNFFIFNQKKMLMLRVKIQMGGFKIYLGLKLAPTEGKERDTTAPQPWFSQPNNRRLQSGLHDICLYPMPSLSFVFTSPAYSNKIHRKIHCSQEY